MIICQQADQVTPGITDPEPEHDTVYFLTDMYLKDILKSIVVGAEYSRLEVKILAGINPFHTL